MSKNNVGVSLSALLSTISKRDIAVSFGFGCVACIVVPFYGLYFVHFHFLLEVSTMSNNVFPPNKLTLSFVSIFLLLRYSSAFLYGLYTLFLVIFCSRFRQCRKN